MFKGFEPADVDIEREVWKAKEDYVKSMQVQPRLFEIGLRAAVICAAVDGRPTLRVQDLDPVVDFVKYQDLTRKVLKPNPARTPMVSWLTSS